MVGVLSTLLSGAGYGLESGNMVDGAYVGRDGQFCMAIRVDAFQPLRLFRERADKVSREIQAGRRRAGVDRLYPPGLLEAEFQQRYALEGIPLNEETLSGIEQAAARLGAPSTSAEPSCRPASSFAASPSASRGSGRSRR